MQTLLERRIKRWYVEVCTFQVDRTLPQYNNDPTTTVATGKYKSLGEIVTAALPIFHGPMVESSFNVMGDIRHAKSSRMNTETYSAIQTEIRIQIQKHFCHCTVWKNGFSEE